MTGVLFGITAAPPRPDARRRALPLIARGQCMFNVRPPFPWLYVTPEDEQRKLPGFSVQSLPLAGFIQAAARAYQPWPEGDWSEAPLPQEPAPPSEVSQPPQPEPSEQEYELRNPPRRWWHPRRRCSRADAGTAASGDAFVGAGSLRPGSGTRPGTSACAASALPKSHTASPLAANSLAGLGVRGAQPNRGPPGISAPGTTGPSLAGAQAV